MRFASCSIDGRRFAAVIDGQTVLPLRGSEELTPDLISGGLDEPDTTGERLGVAEVTFRPVVPQPRKILCVGLNYLAHVQETANQRPEHPVLFAKWADALIGDGASLPLPRESSEVDYEGELAVVLGGFLRRATEQEAVAAIAGYTVANDVTVRDYQYRTPQWLPGKAWTGMTPLGPHLVTPDEVGDPGDLSLRLYLNGELMQNSTTSRFIFGIPRLLASISEWTALSPGDILLTGTPEGVGYRREPQVFLTAGDQVTVEIERVGILSNPVVTES